MPRPRSSPTHPLVGLPAPTGTSLLDLCSGQNRFGTPVAVRRAACDALSAPRPDILAGDARRAVAERFKLAHNQVLIGDAGSGLVWSIARALVGPGSTWLSVEPAVTCFAEAARSAGARVTQWRAVERNRYRVELDQVAQLMQVVQPEVVSLSAPADPTGASVPFSQLCRMAQTCPDSRFVVDQSWLALSTDYADLELHPPENVICIRSLSVEMAVTGLRAAYALCSAELAARIDAVRPPLPASAPAAAAIIAAVQEEEFIARCRSELQEDAARLRQLLHALQLTHTPSVAPFSLVRIARATEVAHELATQHNIAVYDATAVGLPDHLRLAAADATASVRLRTALEHVLARRRLVRGRET